MAGFKAGTGITSEDAEAPSPIVQRITLRAGKLDRTDQEAFLQMIDAVVRLRHTRREAGRKGTKS